MFRKRKHTQTDFIRLDTGKCVACWDCIENCPNLVIGKIDMPWHKHAVIKRQGDCTGCYNCIDICKHDAYSKYYAPTGS